MIAPGPLFLAKVVLPSLERVQLSNLLCLALIIE